MREKFSDYKVQFERNVSFFGIIGITVKHEIDIVIYSEDMAEKYAIELKFPRNGQVPEQMYSFVKDICFMEQPTGKEKDIDFIELKRKYFFDWKSITEKRKYYCIDLNEFRDKN